MLVTSKLQKLYVGHPQSVPIIRGLFFYRQHWSTFNDANGDGLYAEDLIRVVSALGEKKKKINGEWEKL